MKALTPILQRMALGLLGLALIVALIWGMLRSGPLASTRVTVVQVTEDRLEPALFGIGVVEARRSFLIGPTAAGRVRAVAVDAGDAVKAGQLLAEMDPVDLDERKAALEASLARAGSAVAATAAQGRDAQAKRDLAALNARRYEALGAENFTSVGATQAREQELASARAMLQSAQANLSAARQDQQRLAAEVAALQQQRENMRLLAPSDGLVTSRDAEPGSTVVAGQAVLRVIDPSSLWVKVRLDQGRSAGLRVGLPAQVVLRGDPGRSLAGRVARVEAVSDSVTEERVAQVSLEALPRNVSVGELAEVTLALPETALGAVLPNASIRRVDGRAGVWVLDDDTLRFAPVRLGAASLDGRVQVLEGIRAGDRIIVHSEKDIRAGSRIKIVEALPERRG